MREDYKIIAQTAKLEVEIEKELIEKLKQMAEYTKFSVAELANVAVKRFVVMHKDFLPPNVKK